MVKAQLKKNNINDLNKKKNNKHNLLSILQM